VVSPGAKALLQGATLSSAVAGVITLKDAGVSPSVILAHVEALSSVQTPTPAEIVRLHESQVPDLIVAALIRRSADLRAQEAARQTSQTAAAPPPAVAVPAPAPAAVEIAQPPAAAVPVVYNYVVQPSQPAYSYWYEYSYRYPNWLYVGYPSVILGWPYSGGWQGYHYRPRGGYAGGVPRSGYSAPPVRYPALQPGRPGGFRSNPAPIRYVSSGRPSPGVGGSGGRPGVGVGAGGGRPMPGRPGR
jgi:hypothetical protein